MAIPSNVRAQPTHANVPTNVSATLPLDMQVAALSQRVRELSDEMALLRDRLETECVRQSANGQVQFPVYGKVQISVFGSTLILDNGGCEFSSNSRLRLNAGTSVELSAAMLRADAGMAKFSGVVQCSDVIADSVSAKSYTPGAGNVW